MVQWYLYIVIITDEQLLKCLQVGRGLVFTNNYQCIQLISHPVHILLRI